MTDRLKISIEQLYDTFSKYHGNSNMSGSPNYDDLDIWNKQLFSKKLRDLTENDLSRFVGKVISTWGDENDFRHFLPRMLELTAELKTPYEIWILYSKFQAANWKNWPLDEQAAMTEFTISLWDNLLYDNSEKAEWEFKNYFHAIENFYPDFSEVLKVWETNDTFASIKHLSNYIFEERQNLFDNNYIDSIEKNTKHIQQFKTWLTSDKINGKIEKAFYDNEKSEVAERLSWVEQILTNEKKYST